jgi:hypothetical protein
MSDVAIASSHDAMERATHAALNPWNAAAIYLAKHNTS